MDQSSHMSAATLQIFQHHLYELSKGLRPLAMMTLPSVEATSIVARLRTAGIAHHVHEACQHRINVVFGVASAVRTVQGFMTGPLCNLSAEHDFMLGILLGYDREMQCHRFLSRGGGNTVEAVAEPTHTVAPSEPVLIH